MTILQALNGYYGRLAARGEAEAPGWSREKFGWCVVLSPEGEPVDVQDLHDQSGRKPAPRLFEVPAGGKRTSGIASNFLWDKTSYVFGRTAGEGKRTAQEHKAFRDLHMARLAGLEDEGLCALRRFLEGWAPDRFDMPPFRPEMLYANILFRLKGDVGFIHERPAARTLVGAADEDADVQSAFCLVTGERAAIERLHPSIKGVQGAQSSGASLVSFNLDAFTSYGKEQGDNAPTSQAAAFRYGAALNRLLDRNSRNRLARPIGDATVVFWADTSSVASAEDRVDAAEAADDDFAQWMAEDFSAADDDAAAARKIDEQLRAIAAGRPLSEIDPRLEEGTRFHVLGLSPNAARLSVRYWLSDDFGVFARRLAQHYEDIRIEPTPWRRPPSVSRLLVRTTSLQQKFENIPPLLAGEVMRAVLTGTAYPRSLLAAALIRLRAGDDPATGWHAAVIRAVLLRAHRMKRNLSDAPKKGEIPVSLDRDHSNRGYQLGRLFAILELAQRAALGHGVKATIRDKYYGAASATPASIFPLLIGNGQNHLAKVRKEKPGWAVLIEKEIEEVMGRITPAMPFSLPRSLRLEDQGEFAIGYYHQRRARLGDGATDQPQFDDDLQNKEDNDD